MDIIVWCDEHGKSEVLENDFRLIEVCEEDEQNINIIIEHSIGKGFKLTKVHVLDELEYLDLKIQAKQWVEYIRWKNAKEVYEKNKEKYTHFQV